MYNFLCLTLSDEKNKSEQPYVRDIQMENSA